MTMRRLAPLPLLLLLLAPSQAHAAKVLDTRVTCAPVTVYAPSAGRLDVSVAGRGDWDVVLRDAAGRVVAAGASPDGDEVASGIVREAGALTLRACGGSGTAAVTVSHAAVAAPVKAQLVSVSTPTRADKDRLVALGLDMTEHGGVESLGVVLHGDEDRAALRDAGFSWRAVQAAPAVAASAVGVLPSGRTSYRTLADYESELKALAAANPSFVRLITLPHKTYEGREVLGLEIAENVALNDGRPAFLNMGVHHAREWPAGELTMEWAYELIDGYKRGAARASDIVRRSRNLVVPIVNPDGFNASRSAGPADGRDETIDDTVYIATSPGEYRRKNCRVGDTSTALCPLSLGLAENGVDPNRNYGQFWGGPGSDTNPLTQTYRGPAPFSEPESRNVRELVSRHHVTTLITNHTTAGLVLRAPGLAAVGDPVDEHRGYKALGDAMARHNGYFSQKGFELYDTTGTTEDWSYNATGGYGFTFELYCGSPELRDRRLRRARVPPALRHDGQGVGRHQRPGRPRGRSGAARRLRRPGQPRGLLPGGREHARRGAALGDRGRGARGRDAATDQGVCHRRLRSCRDRRGPAGDDPVRRPLRDVPLARQPVDAAARGQADRLAGPGLAGRTAERVRQRDRPGRVQRPRLHRPRGRQRERRVPRAVDDAGLRLGRGAVPRHERATAPWMPANRASAAPPRASPTSRRSPSPRRPAPTCCA